MGSGFALEMLPILCLEVESCRVQEKHPTHLASSWRPQNDVARSGEMPILTFPDHFMQCLAEAMNALSVHFCRAWTSNVASPAHLPVAPALASRQNDATQSRKPPASRPSLLAHLMRHTTPG